MSDEEQPELRMFHVFDYPKQELKRGPDGGYAWFWPFAGQKVLITDSDGDTFEFEYHHFVDSSGDWGPFYSYFSQGRADKLIEAEEKRRMTMKSAYCVGRQCCCGSSGVVKA